MAQDGKRKKVNSLQEKKDGANAAQVSIRQEVVEANSTMDKMETLVGEELREYMSQKKSTLTSKMKASLKRLMGMGKGKRRKRRTTMEPIVAATLKFHKDDDMDPANALPAGTA